MTASNLTVSGNHRAGAGQVEVHEKETDILYMVDGEATFVTGGTMVGGKQTAPGQLRGSDVQGGETRHLKKGDLIVHPGRHSTLVQGGVADDQLPDREGDQAVIALSLRRAGGRRGGVVGGAARLLRADVVGELSR